MPPKHIIISAARACFVYCTGCYNHFGKQKTGVSSDAIVRFAQLLQGSPIKKLTVGGGDPLSRPDIIELLRRLRNLGFEINLDTVGTPLLGDTKTIFNDKLSVHAVDAFALRPLVTRLGIPIDGSTNHIASTFRGGREFILDEQLDILRITEAAGIPVVINTVAHAHNHGDLAAIAQLISAFSNIIEWQIFQFLPTGPLGFRNRDRFGISRDVYWKAVEAARKSVSSRIKFTAKDGSLRKNLYLLIDSDGFAWMPRTDDGQTWEPDYDATDERMVFGNIASENDLEYIRSIALDEVAEFACEC